jgi:hypothetical protein
LAPVLAQDHVTLALALVENAAHLIAEKVDDLAEAALTRAGLEFFSW